LSRLIIRNARIIDPSQTLDQTGNLVIDEGKVSRFCQHIDLLSSASYTVIEAQGMVASPGFIDWHCHLRDPGFPEKETINSGSRAAAKGGFTTICCMPNTRPSLDSKDVVDYVKSTAASEGIIRILPVGCVSLGRAGTELADMAELAAAGVIGFSDDGDPVINSHLMRRALEFTCQLDLPVIDHCEDSSLVVNGHMNEGELSKRLGISGRPAVAEDIMVARDLILAAVTGGWVHIAHVSTETSVAFIREAKNGNIRVTAEVTPHHLTLTEEEVKGYNTNAKVNPPLRTEPDVRALIKGLRENVIDIIATDHAPHAEREKNVEFTRAPSGISVFETALGSLMALVHRGELTLPELISHLSCEPARLLGGKHGRLGTLAAGAPADVTIIDPEMEWLVDTKEFISRGKNTPLDGSKLKGRVMATIVNGEIVYRDNSGRLEINQLNSP
jgi:dihydroorotase